MLSRPALISFISPKEVIEAVKSAIDWIFQLIYGGKVPENVQHRLGMMLAVLFLLGVIWGALWAFSKIKKLWVDEVWPLFNNADDRRRVELRKRFADHLNNEIRRLNNREQWSDHRFAELEAEVEAEGAFRKALFPFSLGGFLERDSLRREKSLSRALQASKERLILVEGEPGSGKSVALRHVAQELSHLASKSKRTDSTLPIYINLKELDRTPNQPVDRELIKGFIMKSLNRVNSRDVENFLDEEFDNGLRTGTWFFLFDSFDELPEILSSVEADQVIASYADAIAGFLGGMGKCRGIIASREFRGPSKLGWPRFRILALTRARQRNLIRKAALKNIVREQLIGNLDQANEAIQAMVSNPMFLGLLIEYVQSGAPFPSNSHVVFDQYIQERLFADQEKLAKRFNVSPANVRLAAEQIAFCMSVDPSIGLNPSRELLTDAVHRNNIDLTLDLNLALDALEYIKLGRSEIDHARSAKSFTFSHRRFQEYFATCVVLRQPGLVSSVTLLTDGRWREAAVVLFQNQDVETSRPLLKELELLLPSVPLQNEYRNGFPWPPLALHLASLLQDGFLGRVSQIPPDLRARMESLLMAAVKSPLLLDKKWAMEVAAPLSGENFESVVRDAIGHKSPWLEDAAYRQASRLIQIPDDIAYWIRKSLANLALGGRLLRDRINITTYISRLPLRGGFVQSLRLLMWMPVLDAVFCSAAFSLLVPLSRTAAVGHRTSSLLLGLLMTVVSPYIFHQLGLLPSKHPFSLLYLRCLVLLWALRFVLGRFSVILGHPSIVIAILYCSAWMPSALASSTAGDFIAIKWWLLQPLTPIPRIVAWIFKKRQWDWAEIFKSVMVMGAVLLGVGVIITALEFVLVWLGHHFPLVGRFFAITFFVIASSGIAVYFYELCRDAVNWYSWSHKEHEKIMARDVLNLLSRYATAFFRCKTLKEIRKLNLTTDSELESVLRSLAILLDQSYRRSKDMELTFEGVMEANPIIRFVLLRSTVIPVVSGTALLDEWLIRQTKRSLLDWGPRCKDELYRLIEYIAFQRTRPTADPIP